MDTVGQRITFIRNGMQLTQQQFADALSELLKAQIDDGRPTTVTRGAVANWERDGGINTKNMRAVADLAEASFDWLANGRGTPPTLLRLAQIGRGLDAELQGFRLVGSGNFPQTVQVFGQAAGSTLANGASILFDQPPIGSLPMLPGLRGLRDIFGLEVTGESMLPMFRPGEPVYVSPHSPVRKDDPIILVEQSSRNGSPRAFIKIMVADRKDRVLSRQLNPALEIEFLKKPGLEVHKVLTLAEALGYSGIEPASQEAELPRFRRPKR